MPEDVDFSKRDCLLLTDIHRTLKKDEQGNVQHLRQWETTFNIVWPSLSYKENFSLEQVPASSLAKELYLLVVMEDEENNLIYSHMEKLKDATPARQATVTTEKGTLTFSLNDGAATLTSYEGEDSAVTVPDTVEELPVKQIASGAFSNKSTVEEVTLPASLEQIGASAFYNCPITEITLPENLRTIGYNAFCNTPLETITLPKNVEYVAFGAFRNCYSLQDIHCKSEAYLEKDGVLFSADGKTLWAFPVGRYDFYEIPTGTELVATYAFAGARELTSVSFPEGLQRLEYRAFEAVNGLQELAFPQSLQYVGQEAFLEVISYGTDYTPADLGVITLGKNLTFVGTGAFDSFKFQGFAVEAGNPSYTAVDGCLYSADGKTLLRVPNGFVGDFTVPDTVTTLAKSAFADCKNMASLTVGAQVTNIEQLALASSVVVRCPAGSAMETYATGLGLTVEVQ